VICRSPLGVFCPRFPSRLPSLALVRSRLSAYRLLAPQYIDCSFHSSNRTRFTHVPLLVLLTGYEPGTRSRSRCRYTKFLEICRCSRARLIVAPSLYSLTPPLILNGCPEERTSTSPRITSSATERRASRGTTSRARLSLLLYSLTPPLILNGCPEERTPTTPRITSSATERRASRKTTSPTCLIVTCSSLRCDPDRTSRDPIDTTAHICN
jgi:hypothetical protein